MSFTLSVYVEARGHHLLQDDMTKQQFFNYIKILGVNKLYLEIYRGHEALGNQPDNSERVTECFLEEDMIDEYKKIFENQKLELAAGLCIGTWFNGFGEQAIGIDGNTFYGAPCFSSELTNDACIHIVERTGKYFNEFILDDHFLHRCFCDKCLSRFNNDYGYSFNRQSLKKAFEQIDEKTLFDWSSFAGDVICDVSKLIVNAAKKINPKVIAGVKIPVWNNETLLHGYDTKRLLTIFDKCIAGTECRDEIPGYYGYSNFSYVKSLVKEKLTSAWFDIINGWNVDLATGVECYCNQIQMSILTGAAEIILFSFPEIIFFDGGVHLKRLEKLLPVIRKKSDNTGDTKGLAVRRMHGPIGLRNEEAFLVPFLGSSGIPLIYLDESEENKSKSELVTVYSADKNYEQFLNMGGTIIVTSEAVKRMIKNDKTNILGLSAQNPINYEIKNVESFVTADNKEYKPCMGWDINFPVPVGPILNPQNAEAILYGRSGQEKFPIVLKNKYGAGTVYSYCLTDFPPYLSMYYPEIGRDLLRNWAGEVVGVKLSHPAKASFWKTLTNVGLLAFENKIVIVNYHHCPIRLDLLFNQKIYGKSIIPSPYLTRISQDDNGWERFSAIIDSIGIQTFELVLRTK